MQAHPVGNLLGFLSNLIHLAANETLDREESVLGVHNSLALGDLQSKLFVSSLIISTHLFVCLAI